jgi:hypothetical protein
MELGPIFSMKNYFFLWIFFFHENIFFLRCEVWDKVVAQKGALPPSKSSIGSKKSAKKKNDFFIFIFIFSIFLFFIIFYYFLFLFILN